MNKIAGFFGPYRYLSNFWYASVEYEGLTYPSTENAYQAAKTLNLEFRKKFTTVSPGAAKKTGRSLVIRENWENIKFDVMYELVKQKFSVHPNLKQLLLDTGDAHLEEANTWGDRIWGTVDGVGLNNLGEILMRVRDELKK